LKEFTGVALLFYSPKQRMENLTKKCNLLLMEKKRGIKEKYTLRSKIITEAKLFSMEGLYHQKIWKI
jgi:hypothetical protein